jgi:uncharacterized UPF0160 family protein
MPSQRYEPTIGTHHGMFHTDDVLAVAILNEIFPYANVVRTRDKAVLDMCDYVVDVGDVYDPNCRRYDHHMANPPMYEEFPDIPLSSAGLVWLHHGHAYLKSLGIGTKVALKAPTYHLRERVYEAILHDVIIPIDKLDNGVFDDASVINDIVGSMGLLSTEMTPEASDHRFFETLTVVSAVFSRMCLRVADRHVGGEAFRMSTKEILCDKDIIVCEVPPPSLRRLSESPHCFVVTKVPTFDKPDDYCYGIRTLRDPVTGMDKIPLPKETYGLRGAELEALGHHGIEYVHHAGFFAKSTSKESAIAFLEKVISNHRAL